MLKGIKKAAAVVVATAVTAPAFATDPVSSTATDDIFAAVDLSTVTDFVTTAGVTIVGIALAMKGITLAKRALNKA